MLRIKMTARIYLIDDQERLLRSLARLLRAEGHEVHAATRFSEVESALYPGNFEVVISDILMPGYSGVDVLRILAERGCNEPVVLITGEPNIETAADAVRLGAFDYVAKPVTKPRLLEVAARALRHVRLVRERDEAQSEKVRVLESLARIGENASMLVHEVKAPISALNHALRSVADQIGADEQEVIREHVSRLERLQGLMQNTLAYARPISRGEGSFVIQPAVTSCVRSFLAMEGNRDVRIELHAQDVVGEITGDGRWVEELLMNLLLNARRAGGPTVQISIRTSVVQDPEGTPGWILEVADDGPGVPVERRARVFEPFESSDDTRPGAGLGLAICAKIAAAFAGEIKIDDDPVLGGARVRVQLAAADGVTRASG